METIKWALAEAVTFTSLFVAKVLYWLGMDIYAEHVENAQYPFEVICKRTGHGLECVFAWRQVVILLTRGRGGCEAAL